MIPWDVIHNWINADQANKQQARLEANFAEQVETRQRRARMWQEFNAKDFAWHEGRRLAQAAHEEAKKKDDAVFQERWSRSDALTRELMLVERQHEYRMKEIAEMARLGVRA